jgi:hypothetical protein
MTFREVRCMRSVKSCSCGCAEGYLSIERLASVDRTTVPATSAPAACEERQVEELRPPVIDGKATQPDEGVSVSTPQGAGRSSSGVV